jgi:hypothetical protein
MARRGNLSNARGNVIAYNLSYPVYVIGTKDGVVVVAREGKECILLFHSEELAVEQIDKLRVSHPQLGPLYALALADASALLEGLKDLPSEVTCAIWDPTGSSAGFLHMDLDELLRNIRQAT